MHLFDKLFARRGFGAQGENFSRIKDAAERLGNPHHFFPSVHIAGTNGKGSVALKIAKTLESSGYKVGLFTSPHIERFEERIQINGIEISILELEKKIPFLMETFPNLCFFDYITLLAFQFFYEQKVDIAVIEAGIGGRFDSTNIICPLVSVVTSLAVDHVELLGSSLREIAYQKAGIIKPGVPVVLGPQVEMREVFEKEGSPVIRAFCSSCDYDVENQATAEAVLVELKKYFKIGVLKLAAKPACRFERCGRFILDVAHNPAGIKRLLQTWDFHFGQSPMNVILAFSSDKDVRSSLRLLAGRADHLFLVEAKSLRAASTAMMRDILLEENISHFTCCSSIEDAVAKTLAHQHKALVCGSFYIMKEVREKILRL